MNWSQLRTVLWLRWRLTRNQFLRGSASPGNTFWTILLAVLGIAIAVGGAIGGVLAGAFGLAKVSPLVLLGVWDGIVGVFLFLWLIQLLTEIQRSEMIDLGRLLHLPVSLKQVFVINYLASHLTLTLGLFVPGMVGLSIGLLWSRGAMMLLLLPLALSFLFMITAWTYCLRGWLITLMVNQRRRRTIIAGVTILVILVAQIPNFYFNVLGHAHHHPPRRHPGQAYQKPNPFQFPSGPDGRMTLPPALRTAHRFLPPLWVGDGAMALAENDPWPAVAGAFGAFLIGALGLLRAYRTTVRFYQGQVTQAGTRLPPAAPVKVVRPKVTRSDHRKPLLEWKLPGVPEEPAALALALFRSLTRAPELKMMLVANAIMPLLLAGMFFTRGLSAPSAATRPFLATGAVALAFFSMAQVLFNQFGFDREGFRALVLLPTQRRQILLAKNLSFLPLGGGLGLIFLALVAIFLRVPLLAVAAAGAQLFAAFLLLSMAGNFVSIIAPYRIAAGSLKPTKPPPKMVALLFVTHLLFPFAMIPIFIPPAVGLLFEKLGWFPAGPVNLGLSLAWLAFVAFLYRLSLDNLGHLLHRREKVILQAVTQEVE